MAFSTIQKIILYAIPLIFAVTVHEVAHGWVANKFGDPTAKQLGRLTLNPIKHIDLVGTIIMPLMLLLVSGFVFGYAKPVPVDWRNLRNPRRDMALVALAGPVSNLLMAFIWAAVAKAGLWIAPSSPYFSNIIVIMGVGGVAINLTLMVLNLIPIPPLDGSRVVASFLHGRALAWYARIERYGFIILIVLLAVGALSYVLSPIVQVFWQLIANIFGLN